MLGDFSLISQYLVAILGVLFYLKNKKPFAMWLVLLLTATVIVESIGTYRISLGKSNFLYQQIYILLELGIIYKMYSDLIEDKAWLKLSVFFLIIFIILWFFAFYNRIFYFYSIIIGAINVGLLVFLYLRELLLSDEVLNYRDMLSFWVSVGFLVFYLPSIPFFSLFSFMENRDLFPILHFLIIMMNIIISFGLIWSNKKEEY